MKRQPRHLFVGFCSWCWSPCLLLLLLLSFGSVRGWGLASRFKRNIAPTAYQADVEYDLVIIGAGASGLYACGAATMLGSKTLMVDLALGDEATSREGTSEVHPNVTSNIGGDCTNSACVPSKAVRSVARLAASGTQIQKISSEANNRHENLLQLARTHATDTVLTVRRRENPQAMVDRDSNLDIALVTDCHFTSPHELSVTLGQAYSSSATTNSTWTQQNGKLSPVIVRSKKFLLATGASPIIPKKLESAAKDAGVPMYTYQTLLRPSNQEHNNSIWQFASTSNLETKPKRIVIAGGGATACELAQSLARLGGDQVKIDLVAPILLRGEDATLQNAAAQLLTNEPNLRLRLGHRVEDVLPNRTIQLSDGDLLPPCDALVLCLGRTPAPSLKRLKVDKAHVAWNETTGVHVKASNLQSISARHVYACGDCCSAVATKPLGRTATHAGWTGYFAAVNTRLPRILTFGSKAVQDIVPRVVYTDPELVSVGLSVEECTAKYGQDGFDRLMVPTAQTDRDDMELLERGERDVGFIELRATKIDGKLIGMTACGPGASEQANEMSVILGNGLSAVDVARSLHSYPSYGYLLYRVALALAFSSVWGSLEAVGTLGVWTSWWGRKICTGVRAAKNTVGRRKRRLRRVWEAEGASKTLILTRAKGDSSHNDVQLCSFLDLYTRQQGNNEGGVDATRIIEEFFNGYENRLHNVDGFQSWLSRCPNEK